MACTTSKWRPSGCGGWSAVSAASPPLPPAAAPSAAWWRTKVLYLRAEPRARRVSRRATRPGARSAARRAPFRVIFPSAMTPGARASFSRQQHPKRRRGNAPSGRVGERTDAARLDHDVGKAVPLVEPLDAPQLTLRRAEPSEHECRAARARRRRRRLRRRGIGRGGGRGRRRRRRRESDAVRSRVRAAARGDRIQIHRPEWGGEQPERARQQSCMEDKPHDPTMPWRGHGCR